MARLSSQPLGRLRGEDRPSPEGQGCRELGSHHTALLPGQWSETLSEKTKTKQKNKRLDNLGMNSITQPLSERGGGGAGRKGCVDVLIIMEQGPRFRHRLRAYHVLSSLQSLQPPRGRYYYYSQRQVRKPRQREAGEPRKPESGVPNLCTVVEVTF